MSQYKTEVGQIRRLDKSITEAEAQDMCTNFNMKFKNAQEGVFKMKQVMQKYNVRGKVAYNAVMDPKQLHMLKVMKPVE